LFFSHHFFENFGFSSVKLTRIEFFKVGNIKKNYIIFFLEN